MLSVLKIKKIKEYILFVKLYHSMLKTQGSHILTDTQTHWSQPLGDIF